jgi:hypothetical protein
MKVALPIAAALLVAGAPAYASASFECETTDGSRISILGNMARAIAAPLNAASLTIGRRTLSTSSRPPQIVVGQSWLDRTELKVDLLDPQMERFEAQLRVRINGEGEARGVLIRNGRSHPVTCEFG